MNMYLLDCEVSAVLGMDSVIIDGKLEYYHVEFWGWLGDSLLEDAGRFIITNSLAEDINKHDLNGYKILEINKITVEEQVYDWEPNMASAIENTIFKRFVPKGTIVVNGNKYSQWSGHDFCLHNMQLAISEKAYNALKQHNLAQCEVTTLMPTDPER